MHNRSKTLHGLLKLGLFLAVAGLWYWWVYIYNPLISDEEMIAHFNEHREEFRELVRRYRYFEVMPGMDASTGWLEESDTKELMDSISVYGVTYLMSSWPPDPYSEDRMERQSALRKELGFSGYNRRYGLLKLRFLSGTRSRNRARENTFAYGVIWKDFVFFPEPPWVEGGWMYFPKTHPGDRGKKRVNKVFQSLDVIPKDWRPYSCVYRRLEERWFLRMCNGR